MTAEGIFQEIRQALSGRPGQAIVLGVCQALAARFQQETWHVRLAFLVVGLFWALPVLAIYILLGFVLPESANRSRRFFAGLFIMASEAAEKICAGLGGIFGCDPQKGSRSRGY